MNNNILNCVFSKVTLIDLMNDEQNIAYSTTIKRYIDMGHAKKNLKLIREIYSVLLKTYRNEYIYKNILLNKLLLGRHSLKTTTALTEVTISGAKADFILINGSATVYEIKTELDSLNRLKSQLENYYKAFTKVYVITSESHYKKVNELLKESNAGICILTKRNTISEKKKAIEDYKCLDFDTLFKLLRKDEYEEIIKEKFKLLPAVSQVKYYKECLAMFKHLKIEDAYSSVMAVLKKRNRVVIEDFKRRVPSELSSLVYFSDFKENDYDVLDEILNRDYRG